MSSITFTTGTIIPATWLSDVNNLTYNGVALHALLVPNGSAGSPSYSFASSPNAGFYSPAVNEVKFSSNSVDRWEGNTTGITLASTSLLGWSGTANPGTANDITLVRDAAGTLAQKAGAAAQAFRVYGTTTGPKYLSFSHDGTNGVIDTAAASGLINIGQTNATSVNIKNGIIVGGTSDNHPIGATTASTGAFTTLSATSLVDISSAAAGQVKFPAAQNSSANVNTLDDYEEGTWTPNLQFGGAQVGITYGTQLGSYTKVGNLVTLIYSITLTSKGSSTGAATFSNLPFTSATSPAINTFAFVGWSTMTSTLVNMGMLIASNAATCSFVGDTAANASLITGNALDNTSFANTSTVTGSITYRTAT